VTDAWPLILGPRPEDAARAMVLLHGRGAAASGMRPLAEAAAPEGTSVLAPQAPGGSWYPARFLAPRAANEPWLSNGLDLVADLVDRLGAAGVENDRIVISGFSQGACLAVEFVARHPARYAGCVAFAGALVGPDPLAGGYEGDLAGTPVHLAVGDLDAHVPPSFVEQSARVVEAMGAAVSMAIRRGMGHEIHGDDVRTLAELLEGVSDR